MAFNLFRQFGMRSPALDLEPYESPSEPVSLSDDQTRRKCRALDTRSVCGVLREY